MLIQVMLLLILRVPTSDKERKRSKTKYATDLGPCYRFCSSCGVQHHNRIEINDQLRELKKIYMNKRQADFLTVAKHMRVHL